MKTAVIMKRELFGCEVEQNSKTEMFSATSLVKAGNVWRVANGMAEFNLSQWLNSLSTKEFITELEKNMVQVLSWLKGVVVAQIHGFTLCFL